MAIVYKIRPGDTLAKLGIPKEVLALNPGISKLTVGTTIKLPSSGFRDPTTGAIVALPKYAAKTGAPTAPPTAAGDPLPGAPVTGGLDPKPPQFINQNGVIVKNPAYTAPTLNPTGGGPVTGGTDPKAPQFINQNGVIVKNPNYLATPNAPLAPAPDYKSQFINQNGVIIKNPNYGKTPPPQIGLGAGGPNGPVPTTGGIDPFPQDGNHTPLDTPQGQGGPKYLTSGSSVSGDNRFFDPTAILPGMTWDEYNSRLQLARRKGYNGPYIQPGPDGKAVAMDAGTYNPPTTYYNGGNSGQRVINSTQGTNQGGQNVGRGQNVGQAPQNTAWLDQLIAQNPALAQFRDLLMQGMGLSGGTGGNNAVNSSLNWRA